MAQDGVMPQHKTRTEFGYEYQWNKELGFWYNTEGGWGRNPVQIFPPAGSRTDWWVVVPGTWEFINLRGEDVEAQCFSIASGFIRQDQGPA